VAKLWTDLSEDGYFVFPVTGRKKYPTRIASHPWAYYIEEKESELLAAHLLQGRASGASICLQKSDPIPLLALDADCYGQTLDDVWARMDPGHAIPEKLTVVRSPSGGFHLWFRLPTGVNPDKLPASFDFGGGISGELRSSGTARRLIMLPGSTATNKSSRAAKYTLAQGSMAPDEMLLPPPALLARLQARTKGADAPAKGKRGEKAQPTEVLHLLKILAGLPEVPVGGHNIFLAKVGQIIGRIYPGGGMTPELLEAVWEAIGEKVPGYKLREFRITVSSGFAKGSKNAEKYQTREKHPTVTDIRAECESVFGGIPWLVEIRDSTGKPREFLLGLGGSAKRRHEATKTALLRSLADTLPTLTRLSGAEMDTVARSPLFIQGGWAKALEYMLSTEKAVDQIGVAPEEKFWELLEEWALTAAEDELFIEAWTEKRPPGSNTPFIVWPLETSQSPALVLPPGQQETLLTQIGDIPKARKLARQFLLEKGLVGMRGGKKAWACPISQLEETTQEKAGAQYELFVRKKAKPETAQPEKED